MNQSFIEYIKQRGFYNQCTNHNELIKLLKKNTVGYAGFDCTADSLHIGSLVPIMLLRAFQKFNHKPIILLGGGTTLIGDPSGKEETRQILNNDIIKTNKKKLKELFENFLSFNNSFSGALIIDNYEWISKLNYVSFIREIGSHFSVNKMLNLDSVKQRIKRQQNLSFLEFNYVLLQSFDFLELYKMYDCQIQFGGSDQWGNIISGIELVRKKTGKELIGLTSPLITTSSGAKMGKTNKGAVWLTKEKLTPYEYWQYWRNTDDKDVVKFLKLFTELPISEIDKFRSIKGSKLNDAKILLANETTKICHGEIESNKASSSAKNIFSSKNLDSNIPEKNKLKITKEQLNNGILLKELLQITNLTSSIGESKRFIVNGAIKINDKKISDKDYLIKKKDFNEKNIIKISLGKKKHGLIEI